MIILSPHEWTGWITAIVQGHYVDAKVYDVPSCYGINEGRVSKLCIGKTASRNPNANYLDQMCYNYDRGLDFQDCPQELVDAIVAELEQLPKCPSKEV